MARELHAAGKHDEAERIIGVADAGFRRGLATPRPAPRDPAAEIASARQQGSIVTEVATDIQGDKVEEPRRSRGVVASFSDHAAHECRRAADVR